MKNSNKRGILIWVPSLLAYIGSLFLPASNPAFFVAIYSAIIGKYRRARWIGACAVLLGSMSLLAKDWYFDESRGTPILRLGPAFYLWMASLVILFIGSLWLAASNAAPSSGDVKQP